MLITLTNARRMFSFELAVKSCGNKKAKETHPGQSSGFRALTIVVFIDSCIVSLQ
jgi:hypothetical protein